MNSVTLQDFWLYLWIVMITRYAQSWTFSHIVKHEVTLLDFECHVDEQTSYLPHCKINDYKNQMFLGTGPHYHPFMPTVISCVPLLSLDEYILLCK